MSTRHPHLHHPARRLLHGLAAALALGLAFTAAPARAADVGVSIGISQPGVYGRIDIGRFPQPQVYVAQPVVVVPQRHRPQPVYLHVPPGHRANWRLHCRAYNACGAPVYFVQDGWYRDHVMRDEPRRGERWDARRDARHGHRHDDRRWDNRGDGRWDDRRDDRRDGRWDDRGPGRGHGRGHD